MTKEETTEVREFEGIEVTYPPEDICTYPEYKGKPYFGIRYRENGESIVGYGTYNPQVLARYLKDYFMPTTNNDIRDNRVKNELNRVKDELEPITKNCESCRYYGSHQEVCNYCYKCSLWTEQEPTTKNDLAVEKTDMIDKSNFSQEQYKTDLQSAYDSGYEQAKNDLEVDWESYKDVDGNSLDDLILEVLQNNFDCGNTYGYKVADEIIGLLPSVTPQEPKTGYISIDDVMSVFDDFMCGEVDEEGTETFLEMLKDKAGK